MSDQCPWTIASLQEEWLSDLASTEQVLRRALDKCKEKYGVAADEAWNRLTKIPSALLLPDAGANVVLDLNARAALLRVSKIQWQEVETAHWKQLGKLERRSANKLAAFFDSERQFPRQRPYKINVRLALYFIFVFEELLGQRFPFSRPPSGGTPRGPAFEAVLAAMDFAHARSEPWANQTKPSKLKGAGVASIVEIRRSKPFDKLLRQQGFRRTPLDVLEYGYSIALTVALARKQIVAARKKRSKKSGTY